MEFQEFVLQGFFGRNTSSFVISINSTQVSNRLVAAIEFVDSDLQQNTTTVQANFFNPTTAPLTGGFKCSILIVNNN